MNTNIKTQTFHKIKYDLKDHQRSHMVILKFQNHLFLRIEKDHATKNVIESDT